MSSYNLPLPSWVPGSQFYHIYPLGYCGAPAKNPQPGLAGAEAAASPQKESPLQLIAQEMDHLADLGVNALYLGPLFDSSAHGYDTADFFRIDSRLGTNKDLADLIWGLKERGIRVILDGVFHHTGRDFFAFRDIQEKGASSPYVSWYKGIDFQGDSPYFDGFTYEGWRGCLDLVKLNLSHPEVKAHLFEAVSRWIRDWGIDGLRLDAADDLDREFLEDLCAHCRGEKDDFWLMGEVIHGDYTNWVRPRGLDAVTNYEAWKGLWSSFQAGNMHEIAWSLNRQFGPGGVYEGMILYNFTENHDVDRVREQLDRGAHLFPLYLLMYTMPGVPSLYYGSEWGVSGRRGEHDDRPLRPSWEDLCRRREYGEFPLADALEKAIKKFSSLRKNSDALQWGSYRQIAVTARQLAFCRRWADEEVIILVNGDEGDAEMMVTLPGGQWEDLLNPGYTVTGYGQDISLPLSGAWGRVLRRK